MSGASARPATRQTTRSFRTAFSVILNAPGSLPVYGGRESRTPSPGGGSVGLDVSTAKEADAGTILSDRITWFMERLGVPNGLRAIGYTSR